MAAGVAARGAMQIRRATSIAAANAHANNGPALARLGVGNPRHVPGVARGNVAGPRPAFLSPFATPALEEADADASATKDKRKKRLRLRIDGDWYDCTGWAKAHPRRVPLHHPHGRLRRHRRLYALHSYGPNGDDTASRRLAMLPKCAGPEEDDDEFVGQGQVSPRDPPTRTTSTQGGG